MDIIVKLIILGFFLKMYLDKKLTNKSGKTYLFTIPEKHEVNIFNTQN